MVLAGQHQASIHYLHRDGASQDLRHAGSFELFPCCWNMKDTIASVAEEPDAEILFSSLEKSSIILIIYYFWCIPILFSCCLFFLGQVTCTDRLQLTLVPSKTELVTKVYIGLFICLGFIFILAILYWTEFRFSIYDFH